MEAATASPVARKANAYFAGLWLFAATISWRFPLVADEAYYLDWSRRLALGYFDHPPMVAWVIWIFGGYPRLPPLIMTPIAFFLLAGVARQLGFANWRLLPIILAATPLGFSGLILMTPDIPLLFFWSLCLWLVAHNKPVLSTFALALCLWSKMTVILFFPGLLVWLGLKRGGGILLGAVLLYVPHVVWGAYNEWLPWSFQAGRSATGFHLHELVGTQILLIMPPVLVGLWQMRKEADRAVRHFAFTLGLSVLAFWSLCSLTLRVEGNWPMLAWIPCVMVVLYADRDKLIRIAQSTIAITVTLMGTASVAQSLLPSHVGPDRDGGRLAACLESPQRHLVAGRYQEMALLSTVPGVRVSYMRASGHRASQYDRWPRVHPGRACDFRYIGTPMGLGSRCHGTVKEITVCGFAVTDCICSEGPVP